jgi:uncharacterized coiled-coil DUF342 family protein
MFNKLWNRVTNSKGLYTQEQINELKEKINKVDNKIESMNQVIEAYMTSPDKNEKRIIANQEAIKQKETEKSELLEKLKEMEEKSVN